MMIEQIGLKGAKSLKIPGVKEEKKTDREPRAVIDHIIYESQYPEENNIIRDEGFRG